MDERAFAAEIIFLPLLEINLRAAARVAHRRCTERKIVSVPRDV